MTVFLHPFMFNAVKIDGSDGANAIDSQKFELPMPLVKNRTIEVAGGDLFDFNYGAGGKLQPRPFTVVMKAQSSTAAGLQGVVDNFFGLPPTGFYGLIKPFSAFKHDRTEVWACDAELASVQISLDAAWYNINRWQLPDIVVVFKPIDLFTISYTV